MKKRISKYLHQFQAYLILGLFFILISFFTYNLNISPLSYRFSLFGYLFLTIAVLICLWNELKDKWSRKIIEKIVFLLKRKFQKEIIKIIKR